MNTSLTLENIRATHENQNPRLDTACAESAQLRQWVLEAVRGWDGSSCKVAALDAVDRATPSSTLLALVVYCYAAGIYASEDIEARLQRDGVSRVLWGSEPVDQHKILRFRRENAPAVVSCLERTLLLALGRAARGGYRTSALTGHRPTTLESGNLGLAIQETLAAEARRRVGRAMFLDSMARDD